MRFIISISITFLLLFLISCTRHWDEHYETFEERVNSNLWDVIQKEEALSDFVQLMKDNQYDTLFHTNHSFTLFIPTNEAIRKYNVENEVGKAFLDYHISRYFIQTGNIYGVRKIQTLANKFAVFEKNGNESRLDGILLTKESPLYANGKYFTMDEVNKALPNLYEYFAKNNPVLMDYIASKDSIILDRERSKPIGFDENGNTIYDSVSIVYNEFEQLYFPVREEFRNRFATIVFPLKDDFENALTIMAQKLGGRYVDYRDIPIEWQQEILIPILLEHGVFENLLEPEAFVNETQELIFMKKNIRGDSIPITYTPVDKFVASNGYAYDYERFEIPDSLFLGESRFELEWLLDQTGISRYAWNINLANVQSDQPFIPFQTYLNTASNDSIVNVFFPNGYSGKFSIEFLSKNLFPRKYLMVVSTHMDIGGIYKIYINDELVKTFDYYDFIRYRYIMPSVTGSRYLPNGRFNMFDFWVDNIDEYGRAKIRFEYDGPGRVPENGLVLDYVSFIPVEL